MSALATGVALLLALASHALGCAAITCDTEAREAAPKDDEVALKAAKAKCEERMARLRRTLREQQREQDEKERRDAFRNRNDAQPR